MRHGHHHHWRRGTPTPEELVERLQARRERLEEELANIQELIKRLGEPAPSA